MYCIVHDMYLSISLSISLSLSLSIYIYIYTHMQVHQQPDGPARRLPEHRPRLSGPGKLWLVCNACICTYIHRTITCLII